MPDAEKVADGITGSCACSDDYKDRELKDPACDYCDMNQLIIDALRQRERETEASVLEDTAKFFESKPNHFWATKKVTEWLRYKAKEVAKEDGG